MKVFYVILEWAISVAHSKLILHAMNTKLISSGGRYIMLRMSRVIELRNFCSHDLIVNSFCFFFVSLYVPIPCVDSVLLYSKTSLSKTIFMFELYSNRLFTICLNCILKNLLIVRPVYNMPNNPKHLQRKFQSNTNWKQKFHVNVWLKISFLWWLKGNCFCIHHLRWSTEIWYLFCYPIYI